MSLSPPEQRIKAKRAKRWVVLCAGLLCFQGVYGQGIDRYADDAVQRLSAYLQIDTINPSGVVPLGPDPAGWLTPHGRAELGGRPFGDGTPPGPVPEGERVPPLG